MARSGDELANGGYEVSLTPIYDDLLREFEGIILASQDTPSTPPPPTPASPPSPTPASPPTP
ncbi:hypothetical protein GCM10009634_43380 [Saccharothrix xinjiangensis]